jgi:protein-L-isoaspartate(D-aspartate) O-methyltransferase
MVSSLRKCLALVSWLPLLGCLACSGCPRSSPSDSGGAVEPAEAERSAAPIDAPPTEEEADPPEARQMRERLVRQIETFDQPWGDDGGWSPRVIEAMRLVPRHLFMPKASIAAAYRDQPHPIGYDQTISQPTVVALMTQALALRGAEKVLEIGTGSGYQAAVLSLLARQIYSIEIVEPLGRDARARLRELGYHNVEVKIGDGYKGWPEHAPFDRIILTAAPPEMPRALVDQLAPSGILVAPVGDDDQTLVRWRKVGDALKKEDLGSVRFVPMVPGPEP